MLDDKLATEASIPEAEASEDFELPALSPDSPELVTFYQDGRHTILRPAEYRNLGKDQTAALVAHFSGYSRL